MRIHNGAFILSRSIYDSDIWSKPSDWIKIWIYLLGKVNFQDNHQFKRGQDFFQYDTIARANGVSYKTVENCMKYLRDRNQIGITRTSRGAIISINNYDTYQDLSNYKETERKQKGNRKESSSDSIIEEGNNGTMKEGNNTLVRFENFWKEYPHKIGKPNAMKKYKQKEHDKIMEGLSNWKEYWEEAETEQRYIPHPATWLNQERWKDDPPEREEKQKSIVLINNL